MEKYKKGAKINGPTSEYTIVRLMNEGGMAFAYEAEAKDCKNPQVFLKTYNDDTTVPTDPNFASYRSTQQEIKRRLSAIKSEAVQTLDEFVYDGTYHQVIEWAPGKNLLSIYESQFKSTINIEDAVRMAAVIVYSLSEFHKQKLVHQDLKFENIFAVRNDGIGMKYEIKLIDFDWSYLADKPSSCKKLAGTPGYKSPEHIRVQPRLQASDVFTVCGVMLFELFAGQHPFETITANATSFDEVDVLTLKALESGKVPLLSEVNPVRTENVDKRIHDIVNRSLASDPSKRPVAEEVHRVLISILTGERAKSRLVLSGGPSNLKCRIGSKTEFSRNMCMQMFSVPAEMVSSSQGLFEPNKDMTAWFVTPRTGTTNATMIDGKFISARTELKPGMKLQIGNPVSSKIGFEIQVSFEAI
jgi:serine/threonine protein kinase